MSLRRAGGRWWRAGVLWAGLLLAAPGWAAVNCTLYVNNTKLVYSRTALPRVYMEVRLACTRLASDPPNISYRITADAGQNGSNGNTASPTRALRLVGGSATAPYALYRSLSPCSGSSDWGAPASGSTGVFQGTIALGAYTSGGALHSYCVDAPVGKTDPPAGYYTDQFIITASYGSSTLTESRSATVTVGMNVFASCVLAAIPALRLDYRSFSATPVTGTTTAPMQCNAGLPWAVSITPASGQLLGLNYTLTPSPTAGAGTGSAQNIRIQATAPAGQSGTCGSGTCSARTAHTLTITY